LAEIRAGRGNHLEKLTEIRMSAGISRNSLIFADFYFPGKFQMEKRMIFRRKAGRKK